MTDTRRAWAVAALAGVALCVAAVYVARVSRTPPARVRADLDPAAVDGLDASGNAPPAASDGATSPRTHDGLWTTIRTGLSIRSLDARGATFQLVRVDLAHHELVVADARRRDRTMATVEELARETGAVAAINGTFFDEKNRPLGWLVSAGEELNPIRNISWWAALAVVDDGERQRADLLTHSRLSSLGSEERASVRFALQVGPRTVADGRPVRLKRQHAARAAACVLDERSILLVVSQGAPVESNALAALMAKRERDGGMGCRHGLMLDGGPSAQMYVESGAFRMNVRGGWPVPNAIAVVPRDWMAHDVIGPLRSGPLRDGALPDAPSRDAALVVDP